MRTYNELTLEERVESGDSLPPLFYLMQLMKNLLQHDLPARLW